MAVGNPGKPVIRLNPGSPGCATTSEHLSQLYSFILFVFGKFPELAQTVVYLPLVQQLRSLISGEIEHFIMKNLRARKDEYTQLLIGILVLYS